MITPPYTNDKTITYKDTENVSIHVSLTTRGTYKVEVGSAGYDPRPPVVSLKTKEDLIALRDALDIAIASNEPVPVDDSII